MCVLALNTLPLWTKHLNIPLEGKYIFSERKKNSSPSIKEAGRRYRGKKILGFLTHTLHHCIFNSIINTMFSPSRR